MSDKKWNEEIASETSRADTPKLKHQERTISKLIAIKSVMLELRGRLLLRAKPKPQARLNLIAGPGTSACVFLIRTSELRRRAGVFQAKPFAAIRVYVP